ncbi:MAG TPA: transcriptional regulator [Clostridium sp.]|jgi:DNA-binding XRE family transcriptional regulator|uniref:Helix-turn-helix transcriptional regulator n=1 Tax=Clostridium lapidicellarium TaxID=3240931 RepID=A0ABV4DWW1_9CLOT|nr:helix-turn-helix transcriptional regulator [Clostridiales bacterium]HBC95866.1 transcriptional regulator [Clostridium sp.]
MKLITTIKQHRKLNNITQEELAQMVNVRRETIQRLEKGYYNPSLKLAYDISKALDTSIEELFLFK